MTEIERFMSKVRKTDSGCWIWRACLNHKGYGLFGLLPGKPVLAHRFAYRHFVSPIPDDIELHHRCKNRACVNPNHLDPVTRDEHLRIEGTGYQTHCKRGHEFNAKNTRIDKKTGHRFCRACGVIRTMAWEARRKAQVTR